MTSRAVSNPIPIVVLIILAVLSVVRNIFPEALPPVGIVLAIIGVVGLALYFVNWLREPFYLVASWMLVGFGVAHWLTTAGPGTTAIVSEQWLGVVYLLAQGLAFIGVYLSGQTNSLLERSARWWPVLPGLALLILATILILEGLVGRERLWDILLPLIPVIAVLWATYLWRQVQQLQQKSS